MSGFGAEIASAYVRIRPSFGNFASETTAGVKTALKTTQAEVSAAARANVAATTKQIEANRMLVQSYREIGQAAARGSDERRAAVHLERQATDQVRNSLGMASREAQSTSHAFAGLRRSIMSAAGGFIGAYGLIWGIRSALTATAEFEHALRQVIGLAGGTEAQVRKFRMELLALAPAVGRTPQELAKALYFVQSSGIAASQSMSVVKASAMAAAAGLGDTATVADAVTSAMNAYGPATLSAAEATDVLVAIVRQGKGEASAIAPVIGNTTALAAQLGVKFHDVGAALASMTRLGVDARTASVQLQQVFQALLKTTPQAAKAFKSVGLNTEDLRKQLADQGLLPVLETLKEAFDGNSVAMSKAFGNIRALRGVLGLVGNQAASTKQIFEQMMITTGSLATAFGAVSKDPQFRFAQFNASLQVLKVTVGSALLPVVLQVTDAITKWISQTKNQERLTRDIREAVSVLKNVISGLYDALTPVIAAIKLLGKVVGGTEHAVALLAGTFLLLKTRSALVGWGVLQGQIAGVGAAAGTSAGKVGLLKSNLASIAGKVFTVYVIADIISQWLPQDDSIPNPLKGFPIAGKVFGAGENAGKSIFGMSGDEYHVLKQSGKQLLADLLKHGRTMTTTFAGPDKKGGTSDDIVYHGITYGALKADIDNGKLTPESIKKLKGLFKSSVDYQATLDYAKYKSGAYAGGTGAGGKGGGTGGGGGGPQSNGELTSLQNLMTGLAASPDDVNLLRQWAAHDQAALDFIKQRRDAGKITNAEYVKLYQQYMGDLVNTRQHIESVIEAAKKDMTPAEKFKAAGINIPGSVSGTATFSHVIPKLSNYSTPLALELEEAKAAITKSTKDDIEVAKKIKNAAVKALKSGHLGMQAQIEAWNTIASANDKLAGLAEKTSYSLSQLFAYAGSTFAQYGSNIAPRGGVLSAQDQRAAFAGNVLAGQPRKGREGTTMHLHFHNGKDSGAAVREARLAAAHWNG